MQNANLNLIKYKKLEKKVRKHIHFCIKKLVKILTVKDI